MKAIFFQRMQKRGAHIHGMIGAIPFVFPDGSRRKFDYSMDIKRVFSRKPS